MNLAKEFSNRLIGEQSNSINLNCMQNLGIYSSTITTGNAFSRWVMGLTKDEIKFPFETVYNVKVIELKPGLGEIRDAVRKSENEFILDFKKCLNSDIFRLEVQYRMEGDFVNSLVKSRSSPEPFGDEYKYHLSAQLIDPKSLTEGFSEVDVDDFPVSASIYVKENIDTVVPGLKEFKAFRRTESEMLSDYNPRNIGKLISLQKKRTNLRRKIKQENPQEALRALMKLLVPARFETYLKVDDEFRLHKCAWGVARLELPGSVFLPESMEVISRTDLNLNHVAAKGVLHYQRGQFTRDVEESFIKK